MELNITRFFKETSAVDYSASIAELGKDAGKITWDHANEDSAEYMILDTDEKREAFRQHIRGFGAWEESEIRAWSDQGLNALLIQCISGDIRESGLDQEDPDWAAYQEGAEAGQYSGRLFVADDGEVYYNIGV